jgi:CBS domain-containing protein
MTSHVHVCRESDTAVQCAHIMSRQNIGFVPIIDSEAKVAGIITDRDLTLRILAAGMPSTTPVRQIMTREIVSCTPDEDLAVAEERMAKAHVSRIVVLGALRRCVGVISLADIARVEESGQTGRVLREVSAREAIPPPALG